MVRDRPSDQPTDIATYRSAIADKNRQNQANQNHIKPNHDCNKL